jgi:hypothetical protein
MFWIIIAIVLLLVTIAIITGTFWAMIFIVGGIFLLIKFITFMIKGALKGKQ